MTDKKPGSLPFEVVCISSQPFDEEIVFFTLEEFGAEGIWSETICKDKSKAEVHGLLSFKPEKKWVDGLSEKLNEVGGAEKKWTVSARPSRDADWLTEWKKFYRPEKIGTSFLVLPAWEDPGKYTEITIRIEPAMAFGTGGHPTTKMCLIFIEELLKNRKPGFSFLDVGTGSGILAIAAWKMGAGLVVGVDNDDIALENSRKNREINSAEIFFQSSFPEKMEFDYVVANIFAETHVGLARLYSHSASSGGKIVLSGILKTKKKMVFQAMQENGFEYVKERGEGEWACLLFQKGQPV
ncbi:MAG: 50S ribosomal protein L11 methyltransferase [Nitrospinota bacterium]